ncbi:MAG TPA: PepSY-associated TM helix domain-containing protein [Polyangiaceae bacterium]|nr:PepSY-associated TM helix domain-containing protein [Polyangiaceae bacterium]
MFKSFRLSMTWLHTWFGLVLGFVLMVVFFFGSLSVFDREIDRWAVPETRFEPQKMPSFDAVLAPIFERIQPEEEELEAARERVGGQLEATLPLKNWSAYTTHRDPVLSLFAEFAVRNNPNDPDDHVHGHVTIDPRSSALLPHDRLNIGSDFFYPMHYSLHLDWLSLGIWIVGVAALVMLAALVSGVVMHRKLFKEFFTFRPQKNSQRSVLDLHNLTGVVALPFHFMFALTGLIIFAGIYFPVSETVFEPLAQKHEQAAANAKSLAFEPAGKKARLASVDAMVTEAKRRWAARGMPGDVGFLFVNHVGDENSHVSIYRAGSDRVTLVGQAVHFEGPTGRVIHEEPAPATAASITEFLTGLHLQHFEHWLLRWLYVLGGLSGCVCIATGLVFFVGKRKQRHAAQRISGARWVDALAITTVTGTLLATLCLLVANRAFPEALAERGAWEERVFWGAWLLAFVHAAWRSSPVLRARIAPAWREHCYAVMLLAPSAVLLNWITTGDHLGRTIPLGYWPVAGFDLALLVTGGIAAFAAGRLRRREASGMSALPADEAPTSAPPAAEAAHG